MPPQDLVQALASLPATENPDLLVGPGTLDDAGVVRLTGDLALVQTVDFFPPIVDDPLWYGRIAAANALSDVYAMGGKPHSVLSIVGWPKELPPELLGRILSGGQEKIDEAGAVLAGGHTVTDREIKYGLAVTGTVDPARILTNAGAAPGQRLVLTKPLGTGALATAIKKGRVSAEQALAAMASMAQLNRAASEAALAHGVAACTDVTGFGLLGGAKEIADASGVTLVLRASALPVLGGALEALAQGCASGGARRNAAHLGAALRVAPEVGEDLETLALDAETSGGLLLCVPEEHSDALLAALEETGCGAALVGEVVSRGPEAVILEP